MSRRITSIMLSAALLLLAWTTPATASQTPKMMAYVNQNSQSFIPVGLLKEIEGVKVNYQAAEKKIEVTREGTKLTFFLGQKNALINGSKIQIPAAPFIEGSSAYVPLQPISRYLGMQLSWDKSSSSLAITSQGETKVLPVLSGSFINAGAKLVVHSKRTFRVGSRSFNTQVVTVSLLHPKIKLDVALAHNKVGAVEDLRSIAKRSGALAAINGTYFDAYTTGAFKAPYGYIASGGSILKTAPGDNRSIFIYDRNNLATIVPGLTFKDRFEEGRIEGAIQAGPRLLTDGKISIDVRNEGFKDPKILSGGGARSAIGITKDHKLILLTTSGATIPQLAEIMKQAGAYQAMNLDGGASSGLYYNGSYLTTPGRQISNAILIQSK
ncbi:copper amine oxidase [Paenibacillus campinasensis]|uniref:Copper amine oxidase n=1 Tax=Paenibacillus campinasensis TaxID=66347 RepID=A0ABW9T3H1_9BACL|nr:phosphodiester glycosidase family protein [Paenibacillus campinasensis]MUG67432.1 copper amine oxidase [Paenibacillus campinasensis]